MRGHKPSGKRTDEAAEAIASVKRVEDRTAVLSLDSYPLRIHRHIHRSVASTKEHKCRYEGRKGWCEREQGKHQTETQGRNRGHRPTAEASGEIARQIHRYERTSSRSKQSESELAWAKRKSGLHGRNACHPRGKNRPIEKKKDGHANSG